VKEPRPRTVESIVAIFSTSYPLERFGARLFRHRLTEPDQASAQTNISHPGTTVLLGRISPNFSMLLFQRIFLRLLLSNRHGWIALSGPVCPFAISWQSI
jgi:hypothetical protein